VLKITITERQQIGDGSCRDAWLGVVNELRTAWKRAHRSQDNRPALSTSMDVTSIDKSGERLLRAMSKKGAQLMARGLYVKHVLEQLKTGG